MLNLARKPHAWFADSRGALFYVAGLSSDLAIAHKDWLVRTHNTIPFQSWTEDDLFALSDRRREFLGKWEISRIAVSAMGIPLAFCIGFEMRPDHEHYHEPGIYLHRLAVAPEVQGRMIGALLQAETIVQSFLRGLCYAGDGRTPVFICGQTNKTVGNSRVRLLHRAAGFQEIGEKIYTDRTDVVLRMDAGDCWSSRHLRQWRRAQVTARINLEAPSQDQATEEQGSPDEMQMTVRSRFPMPTGRELSGRARIAER